MKSIAVSSVAVITSFFVSAETLSEITGFIISSPLSDTKVCSNVASTLSTSVTFTNKVFSPDGKGIISLASFPPVVFIVVSLPLLKLYTIFSKAFVCVTLITAVEPS